jgi:hypothetical protein
LRLPNFNFKFVILVFEKSNVKCFYVTYFEIYSFSFTLQKKLIRAIAHLDYNEHTNDSFKCMVILKLSNLYKFSLGNFIFKIIRTNSDPNFYETISAQLYPHDHVTRNCNKLVLPYYSRVKSHHCILFAGTKFWNSIPPNIHQNTSYKSFKANLEAYLLPQY